MKRSIVFRGSVCTERYKTNHLKESIKQIRKWFSDEIVVSTWRGQEQICTEIEGVDKFVFTEDPGFGLILHNRRQHISFREGVLASSGEVVFVTRPDCTLIHDPFHLLETNQIHDSDFRFVNSRIVAGNMMTFSPDKCNTPQERWEGYFRVGDWFHMGTKTDLLKFGSVLDVAEEINKEKDGTQVQTRSLEQMWLMSAIIKYSKTNIDMNSYQHLDADSAWSAILNNFTIVNTRSTAGLYNHNWSHQPEFYPVYMTENEYNNKFVARYGRFPKDI